MTADQSFATFYIDHYLFGIEVRQVQEILRPLKVTHVPLAPNACNGLINLRGNIVLAVPFRTLLGLPAREESQCMNIVMRHQDEFYSLQVDSVGDVITPDQEGFEAPPETMPQEYRKLLRGAYRLENRILMVLDLDIVLDEKTLLGREKLNEVFS